MKVTALFWLIALTASPFAKGRHHHDRALDEEQHNHVGFFEGNGGLIPDQYVVIFHGSVTNATQKAMDLIEIYGDLNLTRILWHYKHTFQGVTLADVNPELLKALEKDPDVKSVEQYEQHNPANWGLDRIDPIPFVAQEPLDGKYRFDQTGKNVYVLVVDTGVNWGHLEFKAEDGVHSKVYCAFDAFHLDEVHQGKNDPELVGCHDGNGHGTYVAGIVAGNVCGVAKDAGIVSIKVFDDVGIGSVGSAIAGLDHSFGHITSLKLEDGNDEEFVANLSFGTSHKLKALQAAVLSLIDLGVSVVASAGNEYSYACEKAPAFMEEVITVGASTYEDEMALFSNFGECMDLFAPGVSITSSWIGSEYDTATMSGTSAAAALTSGVVALMLEKFPKMGAMEIKMHLLVHAEINSIDWVPEDTDTENLLLNMGGLSLFVND